MVELDHVILTRFNLPSIGAESYIRAQEGWLKNRWELFQRYCVPSVRAQVEKNFVWLVFLDPESPRWLVDGMASFERESLLVTSYRTGVDRDELLKDITTALGTRRERLVTTNLDNDDGIASDFVSRIQATVHDGPTRAIYLTNGLIKGGDSIYFRHDRHNAFCTVSAPWNAPRTCWATWHNLLTTEMPADEVGGDPAWLQVIHGTNVSNKIRGRLASSKSYQDSFPGLLEEVSEPTTSQLLKDRLLDRPMRFIRDAGRRSIKRIAMFVLGKDGIDKAKHWLASRLHS